MKFSPFARPLFLLTLAILCVLLVACGGSDDPAKDTTLADTTDSVTGSDTADETVETTEAFVPETETETETYELYEEVVGPVRIQIYSGSMLRVEEAVDGRFCDDRTIAVTNRTDWPGTPVERTTGDDHIFLKTPTFTVSIPKDAAGAADIAIRETAGETVWKTRTANASATVNLPEPADTPAIWSFSDSPRVTVPTDGFTTVTDLPDNGFTSTKAADYYVFVCGGDPFTLRADYNRLVGPCDMVTVKALGLWFSRFHAYSSAELLRLVREYRYRGYPLDYVVVDTDWRVGSSTGYDINTSLFPDMEQFLAQMHRLNISIAFNDHVREYGESVLSSAQLTWFNENLTAKLAMGLDTWWYDRNWHYRLQSPFAGIDGDMLGQLMYQAIMQKYHAPLNRRTVMLSNYYTDMHSRLTLPAYVGTHRYSVQWSGDITPAVLPSELENMVKLGVYTSTAYVSSDIGGHLYSPTDAMFVRWTQYGALSPIMRYHSSGADRSPWMYGEIADQVANIYINMRYRLMPLFYTLAHENYAAGLPLARRLDFYYPQHEDARRNDQYLLGEDILVAPITEGEQPPKAEWLTAPNGSAGVEIQYFNNTSLSGSPVRTEHASTIDFTWGVGAPASGVPADNFSAVVRATLKVPEYDVYLGTISDDGVRVYVNDQLVIDFWQASDSTMITNKNVVLKANTAYDLRVEYYEEAGGASLRMLCIPTNGSGTSSRTVFIPDGKWMDVFTGEVYEGPQTVTVTHSLLSSPVFVRLGSLTVLAHNQPYADTAQWERLVLDVYPAEGASDTATLYEDDGASLDYQAGKSRETHLSVTTENGQTALKLAAAKGAYTTEWTERRWTVRLHASDVKSITVNGEAVAFETVARDTEAAPFAVTGGSPDGDVVVFSFTADLRKPIEIVVT